MPADTASDEARNTVLIVEDDPATAELERRVLARSGANVWTVGTVREALDMLARHAFSAILLDYQLPDGDPWQIVEAANACSPRIPVVVVTAMGNERVAAEAIHRGVVEYVKKTDTFWDQLPGVVGRVARLAHAEDRLHRSDALFKLIADNASDIIATHDAQGTIRYVSPACRRILGYEPDELVGVDVVELVHGEDREAARAIFAAAAEQGRASYRLRRKDSRYLWVETTASVSREPEGGVVTEIISITRDISERKLAEDVIRREQARLADALAEREVLLQEIHHRVKNNLQVISSLINMQMRRLEPGAGRDALESCQTRVQAIALIHEKLYQTKDYAHVPFSSYARSLARSIVQAGASPMTVSLELDIDELALAMDRAIPCALILNELMTNALKHAFPDGRKGVLTVEVHEQPAGQVQLIVRDNGVGMVAETQVARSESLGMTLVKTLAQQLQGTLRVHGHEGTLVELTFAKGT